MSNNKICVLYHYFEKSEAYAQNLSHFLKFGVTSELDVYLIVVEGKCSLEIEASDNLMIVEVDNKNFDYGGYSEVLNNLVDTSKYEYFFFINSSVRGPFIPPYTLNYNAWFDYFIDLFSDTVGMVGASINIPSKKSRHHLNYEKTFGASPLLAHIQTPIFVLRAETIQLLKGIKFFDLNVTWSREEVIGCYEINLSRVIIQSGWNLKCLIPEFNQFDYRYDNLEESCPNFLLEDILYPGKYLGRTVHPYEIMFIKTGRNLWPECYLQALAISMSLANKKNPHAEGFAINADVISLNEKWFKKNPSLIQRFFRKFRAILK